MPPARPQIKKPARQPDRRSGQRSDRQQPVPITDKARWVAFELIRDVNEKGAFGNIALGQLLREAGLAGRDAAFATELANGTLRAQGVLDRIISACSTRPVDQMDPVPRAALRLGAYQLLRTRVDNYAAVGTSVDVVEQAGQGYAKGFVNAVLRKVSAKSWQQWVDQLAQGEDEMGTLALETAHPRWIVQAWADSLAAAGADAGQLAPALAADDDRPVVHLVARPGLMTAEELALVCGGEQTSYSPYGVVLPQGDPSTLEPVREGLAAVQDEGSQLIARAVVEAPVEGADGGRWLDLCAGPGGKAALMGSVAAIEGAVVTAVEPVEHRAKLVRTATRGLPVEVVVADGRDPQVAGGFDRVLVDAPCSGLGSLRRRPEARWRKSPDEIAGLVALQKELLASAVRLTRPGGVVAYSTCSPHVAETVDVVEWALSAESGLAGAVELLDGPSLMCGMPSCATGPRQADNENQQSKQSKHCVQMWPHLHGTDAMFVALFRVTQVNE